ncbi:MAG: prepilin-type N-terminal cleavage/methylation domain-containing protein [Gammaproteobacteria bacterium]|jgi:prepilin-type N-terminal cleavage/methylation domain-containing protein|nr:prepilin-type N-terminal cleavage/methylation domain-containing protein [Gammaproteobacteria bacterium]
MLTHSNISRIKHSGFTLFELVVVIVLIGIFMTFAIDNLMRLQVDAERVSVQHVTGSINSAINLQVAEQVLNNGLSSLKLMENSNPMDYLAEVPFSYIGLHSDQAAASAPGNSWYFDPVQKILVYTVKNHDYFRTELAGTPRIRFQVSLIYRNNVRNGPATMIQGVHLQSIDAYNWIQNKP